MSTKTTNYDLTKPDRTDNAFISDINNNMDKVDAQMKTNADAVANKADKATSLAGYGITDAYTETEMDSKMSGKSDTSHTHDNRYYTENEIDTKMSGKEPTFTKLSAFNKAFETTASNIKMNGTQAVGTSSNIARADHVHPSDTEKVDVSTYNTNNINLNAAIATKADDDAGQDNADLVASMLEASGTVSNGTGTLKCGAFSDTETIVCLHNTMSSSLANGGQRYVGDAPSGYRPSSAITENVRGLTNVTIMLKTDGGILMTNGSGGTLAASTVIGGEFIW